MTSVCFVVKRQRESLIQTQEAQVSLFYTRKAHVSGERERNLQTPKRLVTWVPAHPETASYVTLQHSDSSTLWWAVLLVKHIVSSLFVLLHLPHTHGSHNELFRVIKTYSSYYCLTLHFWGKKEILGIWEEKLWGFPGIWGFEMFSGNTMQKGGGASVVWRSQ